MQATVDKLDGSRVRLQVEVPPEDLHKEYDRAIRRVAREVNIKGFRRGKAPRHLVENAVGEAYVLRDLVEHLVPRAYDEAVEQTGVQPIDQPQLDLPGTPSLDTPLAFSAEVAVAPTVMLGDVSEVRLEPEEPEVAETDIEARVDQLREAHATWEPVEAPASRGDMVRMQVAIRGEGLEASEPQTYNVLLGENGFPDGFDDAVQGLKAGASTEFSADIPVSDPNPALRGKHVTFQIKIGAVNERRLPEATDEFAGQVGEFETLDALRAELRQRELDSKQHEAQRALEDAALDALVGRSTFEIPDVLIERERQVVVESQTRTLVAQGVAVDTYLGMTGQTRESWEQEARERALTRIRRGLVLEAHADGISLRVADDEVEAEADRIAATYPEARRRSVRRALLDDDRRPNIVGSLRNRASLAKLVQTATGGRAPVHDHEYDPEPPSEVLEAAEAAAAGDDPDRPTTGGNTRESDVSPQS